VNNIHILDNLEYFSLLQRNEIGSGALFHVAWPGHGADHSHLVLKLRINGSILPVPHLPSCNVQG